MSAQWPKLAHGAWFETTFSVLDCRFVTIGTSIKIFLPDASPEGVRIVNKSHWTGVALASPRSRYANVRLDPGRTELRLPGVYVLMGPAEEEGSEARIYVGESEDPRARIDNHHANKEFWNRFVVFTSYGPGLNKATIRYLEARLLQLAAEASRAELDNGNVPTLPPLSEADIADAEAFLADMLVIFPLLRIDAFEPPEQVMLATRYHLAGPSADAHGSETDEGFLVLAGALARIDMVESTPAWAQNLRHALVNDGRMIADPACDASYRLAADYLFKSPSAAAASLLGRSANGLLEWKDDAGRTLKQVREEAVAPSAPAGISAGELSEAFITPAVENSPLS